MPFDYGAAPERYRLGMQNTRMHSTADLYAQVARVLDELGARAVLDVGCADGPLRRSLLPTGPWLVGLDVSATLVSAHPGPVVRADAARLPVLNAVFDAVTALNVLYHLRDPLAALSEVRRVLRPGGYLVASAIARNDSPEFDSYWARPATSFDAEDAPQLLAGVFGAVTVHPWDARLITLPDPTAIYDYLLGRQAPAEVAATAAREISTPLHVTQRGAMIIARRPE